MKHTVRRSHLRRVGLYPLSARLILAGEFLILAALFDFAARLNIAALAGSAGALVRMSDIGSSLSASAVLLCAAGVGLDYLERREALDREAP